jgi:arylsulfatase A-like enzyme
MFGYRDVQKALFDGRWKLIRYPHVDRTQLFDLQSDPFETKDLSADPAQAERIKSMLTRLGSEMKADGDDDPLTAAKLEAAEWKAPKRLPRPGQKGY